MGKTGALKAFQARNAFHPIARRLLRVLERAAILVNNPGNVA